MQDAIIENLDLVRFAKDCEEFSDGLFNNKKHGIIKVYENDNQPVIFLKEVDTFDFVTLKQIAEIHKICWNYQKVLFLYVYTKTEIRIYNCSQIPFGYEDSITKTAVSKNLENLEIYSCVQTDKDKLQQLNTIFSRISIDTGFIWSADEAIEIRKNLKFQNRVDKYLIQSPFYKGVQAFGLFIIF
jgi:hypothetical protein